MARPRKPSLVLPAHVNVVRTPYGEYFYWHPRRGTKLAGKPVRLPGCPMLPNGTMNEEWWSAYRALAGEPAAAERPGTFAALIAAYKASANWTSLSDSTKREWSRHLRYIDSRWGDLLVALLGPVGVRTLIDSRQSTPADANNLLRCTRRLLSWAVERGWLNSNPAREITAFKAGETYEPWPWEAIQYFRDNVSRRDLWYAAALALYTGQRKADVLRMRLSHLHGQDIDVKLQVKQGKTGKTLRLRVHQALLGIFPEMNESRQSVMTVVPLNPADVPLLVSQRGRAWTPGGFDTVWQEEMNRPEMALLRQNRFVFHGLRKSAVVMMLEAGATEHEVMAVTGQTAKMVAYYAQRVNNEKLSAQAILKWQAADQARASS